MIVTAASQSATLLSVTVNIASEMHFNALRSLTQPCLTAYCIRVAFVPEAEQQRPSLPSKVNYPFNSCCHRQAAALSKEVLL